MPMIDMPVDELKEYTGRGIKPKDFNEYWDRAIEEMNNTDPKLEIIKNEINIPNIECYDMYFSGVKNGRIHAKLLKPANTVGKLPAAIHFHGYSCASEDWMWYSGCVAMGFIAVGMDVRGQGGKSFDANPVKGNTLHGHIIRGLDDPDPDNLFFRQIFLDTAQLAKIVSGFDDVDENKIVAFGGSQGGGLTLACAALSPQIKMAAAEFPFLSDYRRVWEMDMTERAYSELKEYFRNFDPRHERENEVFEKLGYIDLQFLAPRIKAETLIATGLMDDVCPASTQFAVYNKIKAKKKMIIYPDFGHENLPGFSDKRAEFFSGIL